MKHQETVIIVDFGGQYAQLIARRVRECGVYCEILPYTKTAEEILAHDPKGIILSDHNYNALLEVDEHRGAVVHGAEGHVRRLIAEQDVRAPPPRCRPPRRPRRTSRRSSPLPGA